MLTKKFLLFEIKNISNKLRLKHAAVAYAVSTRCRLQRRADRYHYYHSTSHIPKPNAVATRQRK